MKKKRKVALYGSNLLMSAIGKSLQEHSEFLIHQIDREVIGIGEVPGAALPDVLVFDLTTVPDDFAISVMRAHPVLLLIGVDIEKGKMLVLSGEESRFLTADDLVDAIEGGGL